VERGQPPSILSRINHPEAIDFIKNCLQPCQERPTASELLQHPFLVKIGDEDDSEILISDIATEKLDDSQSETPPSISVNVSVGSGGGGGVGVSAVARDSSSTSTSPDNPESNPTNGSVAGGGGGGVGGNRSPLESSSSTSASASLSIPSQQSRTQSPTAPDQTSTSTPIYPDSSFLPTTETAKSVFAQNTIDSNKDPIEQPTVNEAPPSLTSSNSNSNGNMNDSGGRPRGYSISDKDPQSEASKSMKHRKLVGFDTGENLYQDKGLHDGRRGDDDQITDESSKENITVTLNPTPYSSGYDPQKYPELSQEDPNQSNYTLKVGIPEDPAKRGVEFLVKIYINTGQAGGLLTEIDFTFNIQTDNFFTVATEMTQELSLPSHITEELSHKMQQEINLSLDSLHSFKLLEASHTINNLNLNNQISSNQESLIDNHSK
jgi:hypothetical protein